MCPPFQSRLNKALSHEAGDFLKGGSPIPQSLQFENKLKQVLASHLPDTSHALTQKLLEWTLQESQVKNTPDISAEKAIILLCQKICQNQNLLYEFVRQVDVLWGTIMQEKPLFQKPGQNPNPNDEYTHDGVKSKLNNLQEKLQTKE